MADATGQISITIVTQSAELNKLIEQFNQGKITAEAFSLALNKMQRAAMAGTQAQAEIKAVQQQAAVAVKNNTQAILDQAAGLKQATAAAKEFQVAIMRTADEAITAGGPNAPVKLRGATGLGMAASSRYDAWAQDFLSTHIQDEVTGNWRAMTDAEMAALGGLDQIATQGPNTSAALAEIGDKQGRVTNGFLGGFRAVLLFRSGMRELMSGSELFMSNGAELNAIMNKLMMTASDSAWVFMGLKPMVTGLAESFLGAEAAASGLLTGGLTLIPTALLALFSFLGEWHTETEKQNKALEKQNEQLEKLRENLAAGEFNAENVINPVPLAVEEANNKLKQKIADLQKLRDNANVNAQNATSGESRMAYAAQATTYQRQIDAIRKQINDSLSPYQVFIDMQKKVSEAIATGTLPGDISVNMAKSMQGVLSKIWDGLTTDEQKEFKAKYDRLNVELGEYIQTHSLDTYSNVKKAAKKAHEHVVHAYTGPAFGDFAHNESFGQALANAYKGAYSGDAKSNARMLSEIERYNAEMERQVARQQKLQEEFFSKNPASLGMAISNWATKFQGGISPLQQTVNNVGDSVLHVTNAWSAAMAGMVTHTMKARDAWKMVQQAAVSAITNIIAKLIEMAVIQTALRLIPGVGNILSTGVGLISPGSSWGSTPIPGTGSIASRNLATINSMTQMAASPTMHVAPSVTVHPIINNQGLAVQVAVGMQELNGRQMRM